MNIRGDPKFGKLQITVPSIVTNGHCWFSNGQSHFLKKNHQWAVMHLVGNLAPVEQFSSCSSHLQAPPYPLPSGSFSPILLESDSALHAAIKHHSPEFEKQANQPNPFSESPSSLPYPFFTMAVSDLSNYQFSFCFDRIVVSYCCTVTHSFGLLMLVNSYFQDSFLQRVFVIMSWNRSDRA